jgi:hypothetical protein
MAICHGLDYYLVNEIPEVYSLQGVNIKGRGVHGAPLST